MLYRNAVEMSKAHLIPPLNSDRAYRTESMVSAPGVADNDA